MRRALRGTHLALVLALTASVLVQAVLAGQFISGMSAAVGTHGAVGGVLELAGLVLFVVAIAHRLSGERSRTLLWGSLGLALAIEAQAALGWAPGAAPTAVHVPLGVAIFAGAVALSVAMLRGRRARPDAGRSHVGSSDAVDRQPTP